MRLISFIDDLRGQTFDVVIVGSGPAGVAVAEQLYRATDGTDFRIALLEQGPVLAPSHVNNVFGNQLRRKFIDRFKTCPWDGDFADGGMLLPALGGRGIAAGAHLRRFDDVDFTLWEAGCWPDPIVAELQRRYYRLAEQRRKVAVGSLRGPAQIWAMGELHKFNPAPPTIGVDLNPGRGFEINHGVDSSVFRLWSLLLEDALVSRSQRLVVATEVHVGRLRTQGSHVTEAECYPAFHAARESIQLSAGMFVLAASTIESSRLVLASRIQEGGPAVGRFLSEHVERRAKIEVDDPHPEDHSEGISLVLHSRSDSLEDRFQIHFRGQLTKTGKLQVDIGGFAAMDPVEGNAVTLSPRSDQYGFPRAHITLNLSAMDNLRTARMCERILEVADALGGTFITEQFPLEDSQPVFADSTRSIEVMARGRSYHEAGGLRFGTGETTSVTDVSGCVRGVDNLFVADASTFPCVGVANPMLTITALAYRVADNMVTTVSGHRPSNSGMKLTAGQSSV